MPLSIIPVSQIFGKYDQQTRIGELNRGNPVKTIQNQVDRVTISPEALKKRAIDAALAAIQNSSEVSTEAEPASGDNVESGSYADRIVQNALEKSKERKEGEKEELSGVIEKFVEKSKEITEQSATEEAAMILAAADKEIQEWELVMKMRRSKLRVLLIFLPDEYLAKNTATQTNVKIISWKGKCEVHEKFTAHDMKNYKKNN